MQLGIVVDSHLEALALNQAFGKPAASFGSNGFVVSRWDMEYSSHKIFSVVGEYGSIDAAICTQYLIDRCNITKALNIGFAYNIRGKKSSSEFGIVTCSYYRDAKYSAIASVSSDEEAVDTKRAPDFAKLICASDGLVTTVDEEGKAFGLSLNAIDIYDAGSAAIMVTCNRGRIPVSCLKYIAAKDKWLEEAGGLSMKLAKRVRDMITEGVI